LLTAWVIPLFALFLRRSLRTGRVAPAIGGGVCLAVAAYAAYYHVVYLALLAVAYVAASWHVVRASIETRTQYQALFTVRLILVGVAALDAFLIFLIATTGGGTFTVGGAEISARGVQNPMLVLWLLLLAWVLTKWRLRFRFGPPGGEMFWRGAQTVMIAVATFTVICLPLVIQAFRLAVSGRYVSQTYFWRSAPRGIDALAPALGNPLHPLFGGLATGLYERLGLDRIEAVGWLGVVPFVVLLMGRGKWSDVEEARRWKVVLCVFAVWALGPFLTIAGFDAGLPLPQALARFVPVVENARMPGRAMVGVYLALGVLMALRVAGMAGLKPCATGADDRAGLKPCATEDGVPVDHSRKTSVARGDPGKSGTKTAVAHGFSPGYVWVLIVLLALDYLPAPIPLTALDRPAVYEQLRTIDDSGAVIEVPFGIGDGLSPGRGSQERRLLYYATIHGHPLVGGYIGRMPPNVAQAYEAMPVVGNLLRLSSGEDVITDDTPVGLPFRYLVLDTNTASPELVEYVRDTLDMDLITSGDGKQLYAVQGMRPSSLRASRQ
jgi:hypothetical protein